MRRPRTIGVNLRVPLDHRGLALACAYLTLANQRYLREHPRTPRLMKSGVRYQRDPAGQEPWRTIPEILERKKGDCEDLACWYAAELRQKGIRAYAVPQTNDGRMWHIVVRLPDGRVVDPSKMLGMK